MLNINIDVPPYRHDEPVRTAIKNAVVDYPSRDGLVIIVKEPADSREPVLTVGVPSPEGKSPDVGGWTRALEAGEARYSKTVPYTKGATAGQAGDAWITRVADELRSLLRALR